ncbi:hypothetical protein PHET_00474 [Paragonimus heterotremus]|uniref:Uncharacterized protein n=1 Tax=Paragonimus heterotremus TaxID=100268 RepID=A0A8J4X3J7_9TREM|nr:hypothetical protein PHET_00474 [Paragonimus heterotremus]
MNASEVPGITLRLRHLNAIKVRNIVHSDMSAVSGLFFAISLIDPDNFGYFFVSSIADYANSPEWDPVDLTTCPQWILASKAAIFTFFAVQDHSNVILFEIEVYFSGLVLLDSENHDLHPTVTFNNEVYFQFGSDRYASPSYLSRDVCSQCIRPRPTFRVNLKPSYDFEMLQRFLVNMQCTRSQNARINTEVRLMYMLKAGIKTVLDKDAEREICASRISLLNCRLNTVRRSLDETLSKLGRITQQRATVEENLEHLSNSICTVTAQLSSVSQVVAEKRACLTELERVLSYRIMMLLTELFELFGSELRCLGPGESMAVLKLLTTYRSESTRSVATVPVNKSQLSSLEPNQSVCGESNGVAETVIATPVDSQLTPTTVDSDVASITAVLGTITHLLRLLAAIFNQPLRYPLDMKEGVSRARVTDLLTPSLSDGDRRFPLYLLRTSALPAYKHALALVNRDVSALRALLGLTTQTEEATVWNMRTLLQHCLSSHDQVKLF